MGNVQNGQEKSLHKTLDYIATNYIFTDRFQHLNKLTEMKYCNDLVVLTSKVLEKNLNMAQVKYLSRRVKKGIVVNEMEVDNMVFFTKTELSRRNVNDLTQKKRLCKGIAKFYIKVAHLFAAIFKTLNPVNTSNNENEAERVMNLMRNNNSEKNDYNFDNICTKRIDALINSYDVSSNEFVINSRFCDMNKNHQTSKSRTLSSEPGIPELSKLYYDVYNYESGKFSSMSKKMKKEYMKDVKLFYREFTGNENVPANIKRFSNITLREYHKMTDCKRNGAYKNSYEGNTKNILFRKYATHIKNMMKTAEKNRKSLVDILNELFTFQPNGKKMEIIINPSLNNESLQELINRSRNPIIHSYIKCEQDFITGLELFEAIVESLILKTTKRQVKLLEKEAVGMM